MHTGRTEEAGAVAARIRAAITRSSMKRMRKVDTRKSTKDAWAKVREVVKEPVNHTNDYATGLTARLFNDHYAAISTDNNYRTPRSKVRECDNLCYITEMQVFRMLDTLPPTATGLDMIPAWFLRLGALIFAAPLAQLFQQSLATYTGVAPRQLKNSVITPVPKVATPTKPSDFRPISITPVLSRSLERFVVGKYIYPALLQPNPTLDFTDQFAFRPSGSTTAAIVATMHTVRSTMTNNDYDHVFAFDFSKAFDTVSHASLTNKLAQLAILDSVYNWILDFFSRPRSLH